MKIRVAQVLLPFIILIITLTPAVVFAETETTVGAQQDFDHIGLLPDGKVIVTEPDASPTTTLKPPVTSSTKILRDGTVVTSATTATTAIKPSQPADEKAVTTKATASTTTSGSATTQRSGTATTDENEAVVVLGEQIKNPATMSEEKLPLTGLDLKPYFAIAILLIILGRATYTKAAPRP